MEMIQEEIPGIPKKPRPNKGAPEVIEDFKKEVLVKLDKLFPDEDNGDISDHLVEKMIFYNEIDGYRLAKSLDDRFYIDSDFETADMLNDLHWELDKVYGKAVKKWIEEQGIKVPFEIGDEVSINVLNSYVEGEIHYIYEDSARVSVFCESLGHVRSGCSGTLGIIKNCEDVKSLKKYQKEDE